jgi:hypothetical protein
MKRSAGHMREATNRFALCFAVALATAATGCKEGAPAAADAGTTSTAPPASAPVASPSRAPSAAVAIAASNAPTAPKDCITTKLQPGHCAPASGKMKSKDVVRWAGQQGVTGPESIKDLPIEACQEVSVGAPEGHGVACVMTDPVRVDKSLGDGSPAQINLALAVFAVVDHKLVELASVPLGIDELFRAPWKIDPAARVIELAPDAEDCKAAGARLTAFWNPQKKKEPAIASTIELQRQASVARVEAVCRAPQRTPLAAHPISRK